MEIIGIDINCDVGEGLDNEAALFPYISSCSIACGGHAGNERTMRNVVRLAKKHGVRIGAHPSYPDPLNFGRLSMDIPERSLMESIRGQIDRLMDIALVEKVDLNHIKTHGALYHDTANDLTMALILLKSLEHYKGRAHIYAPYGSLLVEEGKKQGFSMKLEAFGDRVYRSNLQLVPRSEPNSLVQEPGKVLEQIVSIARNQRVVAANGSLVRVFAHTICIHGDTPSVLQIVSYLSKELPNHNIQIRK